MKKNNKGFTLAELLIVVAIIAVLVAVAIPVFTQQLEKSRDATSVANMRSAYAEAQVAILTNEKNGNAAVPVKTDTGYTVTVSKVNIKTEQGNAWSNQANDLPFTAPTDPGASGTKSMVFTYDADYNITKVEFGS